jgi:hypothetical protein
MILKGMKWVVLYEIGSGDFIGFIGGGGAGGGAMATGYFSDGA